MKAILVAFFGFFTTVFAIAAKILGLAAVVTLIAGIVLYVMPDLSVRTYGDMFGYMLYCILYTIISLIGLVISFVLAGASFMR